MIDSRTKVSKSNSIMYRPTTDRQREEDDSIAAGLTRPMVGLCKIFVWFEGHCTRINTIIRKHPSCLGTPLPPCIAHTIVQYSVSPDQLVLQELPYNIGNGNIV